ncbi:UTP--glucose-1-phosphate uridylyltransferase [Myxococcota bacterium]|nr:UTP--glucose-1-phosphate uridylyltransferase [Myxococcota bacterium]
MKHPLDDPRIDWAFLRAHDFDEARFRRDADAIVRGTLTEAASTIAAERITPTKPSDTRDLVTASAADVAPYRRAGEEALKKGEVAVVVLNGGMATRFGGVVKGVVEVFDGETFISLKAQDVARAHQTFGARIPLVLMNSFATHASTLEHVESKKRFGLAADDLLWFQQSVSLRMNPDGSLFIGDDGLPSYHAPGHGDFFSCIRRSGVLGKLRDRGVKTLLFSNVDNLGATIDPVILGYHLLIGADMSAEITEKRRTASGDWDKGGAPAYVDGRLQIVEGFRFPPSFQQESLPDFSTNNFLFRLAAIDREVELERHVVKKKVDGRPALQLESITCEASGVTDARGQPSFALGLFRVPREGATGRFFPVKEPQDLEALRDTIKARMLEGWALRDKNAK